MPHDWLDASLSAEATTLVDRIASLAKRSRGGTAPVLRATVDGVLLDEIETTQVVELGPPLVALKAWDALAFTPMLQGLGMNPLTIATAQVMISNRLIEPLSEWALSDWAQRTALPELLDVRLTRTTKDRLYRVSDALLEHRKAIESTLRAKSKDLFSLKRSVVLYDVTNTHFEGVCHRNPKARHGKNKQKRNDCRQVAVGMAFDEHGLPLAHEVFEGNVSDSKTLEALLDRLSNMDSNESGNKPEVKSAVMSKVKPEVEPEGKSEAKTALKPVVILDAGFASAANLKMLKARGWSYLINITRGSRQQYADSFATEGFDVLPGRTEAERVEVKKITDPKDPDSVLVLCRSAPRRLKEVAMLSTAEERFLRGLKRLEVRLEKGQLKNSVIIERQIGALLKKHPRVARFYKISHEGGGLKSVRHEAKVAEALSLCGDYVLKTDRQIEAGELWQLYMTLLRAEEGFSLLKGSLGLRPNYHQLEDRVEGHIFISILAYHLLCRIRYRLVEHGDPRDWKTVRRLLRTHRLVTTRLPAGGRAHNRAAQAEPARCRAGPSLPDPRGGLEESLPGQEI